MRSLSGIVLATLGFFTTAAAGAAPCNSQCQQGIVDRYFQQLSQIYKTGSTAADIDVLFNTLTSDVQYQHLNYQAQFDRAQWHSAFTNNQNLGRYQQPRNLVIKVDHYLHGQGYVAVTYSYGVRDAEGTWQPQGDQQLLAVFALREDKIRSVQELW